LTVPENIWFQYSYGVKRIIKEYQSYRGKQYYLLFDYQVFPSRSQKVFYVNNQSNNGKNQKYVSSSSHNIPQLKNMYLRSSTNLVNDGFTDRAVSFNEPYLTLEN